MEAPQIILASGSAIRAQVLSAAHVPFSIIRPDVDEDAIKRKNKRTGASLETTAQALADAKALAVTAPEGALVIGADQILEFEGRGFDKPATMEEARQRLQTLQGAPHTLINAVTVARGGSVIYRNIDRPQLLIRRLEKSEIDAYLEEAGPDILSSVGAYQVEKSGARLFERIEGDYFAVLGLSLFPLLAFLRREGALEY